jgi:hypothetical protein
MGSRSSSDKGLSNLSFMARVAIKKSEAGQWCDCFAAYSCFLSWCCASRGSKWEIRICFKSDQDLGLFLIDLYQLRALSVSKSMKHFNRIDSEVFLACFSSSILKIKFLTSEFPQKRKSQEVRVIGVRLLQWQREGDVEFRLVFIGSKGDGLYATGFSLVFVVLIACFCSLLLVLMALSLERTDLEVRDLLIVLSVEPDVFGLIVMNEFAFGFILEKSCVGEENC